MYTRLYPVCATFDSDSPVFPQVLHSCTNDRAGYAGTSFAVLAAGLLQILSFGFFPRKAAHGLRGKGFSGTPPIPLSALHSVRCVFAT